MPVRTHGAEPVAVPSQEDPEVRASGAHHEPRLAEKPGARRVGRRRAFGNLHRAAEAENAASDVRERAGRRARARTVAPRDDHAERRARETFPERTKRAEEAGEILGYEIPFRDGAPQGEEGRGGELQRAAPRGLEREAP
jgi:hypothetical protein